MFGPPEILPEGRPWAVPQIPVRVPPPRGDQGFSVRRKTPRVARITVDGPDQTSLTRTVCPSREKPRRSIIGHRFPVGAPDGTAVVPATECDANPHFPSGVVDPYVIVRGIDLYRET